MDRTTVTGRPTQLAPVRIGKGKAVHLGCLSWVKGPNGEPRYTSYCPAGHARLEKPVTVGEAVAEEITCKSCRRQAGAEALARAAETAEAMIEAAPPTREYGHDERCIGCGAQLSGPCQPRCGFEIHRVGPAMLLRAAAARLDQFTIGHGADLRAVLYASLVALRRTTKTDGVWTDRDVDVLIEIARDVLAAHLHEVAGPDLRSVERSPVDEYAVLVPRRQLAESLYLAAARHDGVPIEEVTRERLIGQALRELQGDFPDADRVYVGITDSYDETEVIEFLGVMDPDGAYAELPLGLPVSFDRAGELIRSAVAASRPGYLRPMADGDDDGVTFEFEIAATTYGKTLHRRHGMRADQVGSARNSPSTLCPADISRDDRR